jgi:hypothetical protein
MESKIENPPRSGAAKTEMVLGAPRPVPERKRRGGRGWVLAFTLAFYLTPNPQSPIPVLHADRLITSGHETNATTTTEWTATSGTFALDTATVHSGVYSMRYNLSAQQGYVNRLITTQTSGTLYTRFFARWTTLPSSATPSLLENSGSGGTTLSVKVIGGGSPVLRLGNGTTGTTALMTTVLSTSVWYRIEVSHVLLDAGGSMELRLYSDMGAIPLETVSITGEDTLRTNVTQFYFGSLGGNSTQDFYMDDIVLNTSAGVAPFNTWAGGTKFALLKPTSNSSVTWTRAGANCSGTTNADCVDDEPGTPDDASGYATSSTANNEDRLNVASLPSEIPSDADMISLTVYDRWDGNGTTGTRQGRHLIWDEAGAQTNGPTHTRCDVTAGSWSIATPSQITVLDLGTRSKANVGSFDLGYEPLNTAECRVTAIWGNVEWKPAPSASPRRRRPVVW